MVGRGSLMTEKREDEVAEVTAKKANEYPSKLRRNACTYSSRVFCVKIMYERRRSGDVSAMGRRMMVVGVTMRAPGIAL